MLPVGGVPSAMNSREKTVTPKDAGLVVEPAYVPLTAPLVNEPAAWGSPKTNKKIFSQTKRKARFALWTTKFFFVFGSPRGSGEHTTGLPAPKHLLFRPLLSKKKKTL